MNYSYYVYDSNGGQRWSVYYDTLHNENGPAYISFDGAQLWFKNGVKHREDGPAIIFSDGGEMWYRNGLIHIIGGPAANIHGVDIYYLEGQIYFTLDVYHEELMRRELI